MEGEKFNWLKKPDLDRINNKLYLDALNAVRKYSKEEYIDAEVKGNLNWLNIGDKKEITNEIDAKENYLKGTFLYNSLSKIVTGQYLLNEKPDFINKYDWDSILSIQNRIISKFS